MEDGDFLARSRIAIVGLGLMGGSLALALKGHYAAIYGVDRDPMVVSQAVERKVVQVAAPTPEALLPEVDVIILATPVKAILELLKQLPSLHPGEAIVLDVGSTKVQITQAMLDLPPRFDTVGGHPMCGKEQSGLEYADPHMFEGAAFAFTHLKRTSLRARAFCEQLAQVLGARPIWLDPDLHDHWTAATSHFPYLLANALAASTPPDALPLVGPGFRSTTRLAVSSSAMMRDILATNRENVLTALSAFKQQLGQLERLLDGGDFEALEVLLAQGAERQKRLSGSSDTLHNSR
jgi:prephenate dehydrogenase